MINKILFPIFQAMRPNQWIKNLILFTTIIFNGKLFIWPYFSIILVGFVIFCAVSSASYIFNDIIDLKYDKLHPLKNKRPLASGKLKMNNAAEIAFLLAFFGLISALLISASFFMVTVLFLTIHALYTLFLKKYAVFDILSIAFSFILRAYAGEILTGFHLPFWLFMTILFASLFVAATKRHAELLREGSAKGTKTRPTLFQYRERLLDSYTSMFGSASIIAYSLFAFLEEPPKFNLPFQEFLKYFLPGAVDRKWMIISIPFMVFGLMRYAQLAYLGTEAEQPEKIITKDKALILSIIGWGITMVLILYIL
jgi:decaprenyl-phosphate phosphoribosyltransferase